jgi:hypothetical protein
MQDGMAIVNAPIPTVQIVLLDAEISSTFSGFCSGKTAV